MRRCYQLGMTVDVGLANSISGRLSTTRPLPPAWTLPSRFILAVGHVCAGRLIVWVGSVQPHHHVKQIKHSCRPHDIGGAVLRRSTTAIFVYPRNCESKGITLLSPRLWLHLREQGKIQHKQRAGPTTGFFCPVSQHVVGPVRAKDLTGPSC